MAGGLFSRIKSWIFNEDVASADLNGEFDNIISHLGPIYIDNYSHNVPEMQSQTDPGAEGSESLAPSLAGELERLRYAISRIVGGTYWYDTPESSLQILSSLVNLGGSTPLNRIVSGRVTADLQPDFLQATGSAPTFKVLGAATNLLYFVAGVQKTLSGDVTSGTLNLAPSTNNTATLTSAITADDAEINLSGAGTAITALVGQYAAFKVGGETFVAYVKSSSRLSRCLRGIFFDSTDASVAAAAQISGATVTLLKLVWVYVDNTGAIQVAYTNPAYALQQPSSPSSGDYWFDFSVGNWKTFNGSTWVVSNSTLIGFAITDTTNCIGTRSFDFFKIYSDVASVGTEKFSTTEIRSGRSGFSVSVYGSLYSGIEAYLHWVMPGSLESGFTQTANTVYYLYVKSTGDVALSPIRPLDRSFDLRGWYHPAKPWRCVGRVNFNGSSQFDDPTVTLEAAISASSGTGGSTATAAGTDYTNLTCNVVTRGRPVLLVLTPDPAAVGGANPSNFNFDDFSAGTHKCHLLFLRDGVGIGEYMLNNGGKNALFPPVAIDLFCPPGFHNYKIQAWVETAGSTVSLVNLKLVAIELGGG